MASQAERYRKKIKEYSASPVHDPKVLAEMNRQFQYANTIDLDISRRASEVLNSEESKWYQKLKTQY